MTLVLSAYNEMNCIEDNILNRVYCFNSRDLTYKVIAPESRNNSIREFVSERLYCYTLQKECDQIRDNL